MSLALSLYNKLSSRKLKLTALSIFIMILVGLMMNPSISEAATENLWGNITPPAQKADNTRYELGTVFSPTVNGTITGVRVYAVQGESGTHTVRIWNNSTSKVIKGPNSFTAAGTGWRTYAFSTPLTVNAGMNYTVSITTGGDSGRRYSYQEYALIVPGNNGQHITYPANAGVYTTLLGKRPTQTYRSSNYFRDVVFNPLVQPTNTPTPTSTPTPIPPTATPTNTPTPTPVPPTPTNTPTPTSTSTPTPTAIPTPVPCEVTTSPETHNLVLGGTGTVTAVVSSGLGSSSITQMRFGSYDTSIVTVNPASESASPYSTVATALTAGATAVWATADLSDGRVCQSTGTTDTDVAVTNPTPTPTNTPTPVPPTATPTPTSTPVPPTSTPTPTNTPTPTPVSSTYTLWPESTTPANITENDPNAVELGVKFKSSQDGQVLGIRFYKGPQNIGTHTGSLWNSSGTRLATVTFTNETSSGWQEARFDVPVNISADILYTASYHTDTGYYSYNSNYFSTDYSNNPLTAPSSSSVSGNGVYLYGASAFPNQTWNANNYWVDVVFSTIDLVITPTPSLSASPTPTETPSPTPTIDPENSPVKLGINADLGGMKPFPADDPWNINISNYPIHPEFARIQSEMDALNPGWRTVDVRADFGSGTYAGSPIGIPYIVAPIDQPLVPIINKAYGGDEGPYPMPPNTPIESINATDYADRHAIVVQRDITKPNHIGHIFELFRAYPQGNYPISVTEWWANSYAKFDANANTLVSRSIGQGSTDAAGLPIFPGLVRYDEVQRAIAQNGRNGDLGHAVRFTVGEFETEWSIIAPATAVAGHNTGPIPFGSRWRLRADWQVPADWPDEVAVIINTLKKYGMLQADNSAYWGITGAPDERWNNDGLSLLRYMKKGDFQMVDTGPIIQRTP